VGSIVFVSKDPFNQKDLVDPVLASGESDKTKMVGGATLTCAEATDGLIHDRWTLIEDVHQNMR
jgi:hypothetical protein